MDGRRPARAGAQNPAYRPTRPPPDRGKTCLDARLGVRPSGVYLAGEPGPGSPAPPYVWPSPASDDPLLAGLAADDEGAADQMLSGILELLELLAVPFFFFSSRRRHTRLQGD